MKLDINIPVLTTIVCQKMLGVLSEQQKHLQLCELDNLRLIEAGHQHQTRILEDARKQELLELLSLMQETHQLLILCADHLSRGYTAPSGNGIAPSASSLPEGLGKKDLESQDAADLKETEEKHRQELKVWQNVAEERGRALQESLQLRHRRAQREQEQQRHVAQLQERCQLLQHQLVTAQDENQRCLQLLEKHQVRVDTSVTHEEDLGVVCGELESEKTMLKQVQSQLIKAQDDARMWQVCCAVLSSLAVFSSTVLHNCISPRLLSALVYLVYLNAYGGWQELAEIRTNIISPAQNAMASRQNPTTR